MKRTRGFTLIELLTVMAIIALLVGLLLPALAQARAKAQMTKDQAQIKQIHAAWTTFARDYNGVLPTPGLINRLPDPLMENPNTPGRGPEDLEANDTAAMYSACIMQNYFTPQILIAPTEPSGFVAVKDDYCWAGYSPIDDYYWDFHPDSPETGPLDCPDGYIPFAARLDKDVHSVSELLCNTSYAHTPIAGKRKSNEWRDTLNSKWAIIGNRGVRNGIDDDKEIYEGSVTLRFHGGDKEWLGNIGFNDNHVSLLRTFFPEGLNYLDPNSATGGMAPDNLFRNDSGSNPGQGTVGDGIDVWLAIVSEMTSPLDIITEWD